MPGDLGRRGDEGGDAALHVDRAAAVEQAAAHLRRERVAAPALAGRDHVEMAGEAEMGAAAPRVANKFSTSPLTKRWTSKPSGASAASSTSNTAPLAGVTLGQAISAEASSTGSIARVMRLRLARGRRLAQRKASPCPSSISTRSRRSTSPAIPRPGARRWRSAITAGSAPASGLSDFGVSHVTLEPGGISSQRHWHEGRGRVRRHARGRGGARGGGGRDGDAGRRLRRLPQGRRQRPPPGQPERGALRLRRDRPDGRRPTATIPTSTCISTAPPAASPARTARLTSPSSSRRRPGP